MKTSSNPYRPTYIPLDRNKAPAQFPFDKNSKIPVNLPPTTSPDGTYYEHPIPDYDQETDDKPVVAARRMDSMAFLAEDDVFPLPNVRRRRQNENEQARLLSQSAFTRISETLGALNTVGNFFLNITREANGEQHHRGDMQLISSSSMFSSTTTVSPLMDLITETSAFSIEHSTSTKQSVPDALLTITKNVLGQNMTKTIEPLVKRVGTNHPVKDSKIDKQSLNEKIDMAALAEKKRKKHQAVSTKKETIAPHTTVSTTILPGNF